MIYYSHYFLHLFINTNILLKTDLNAFLQNEYNHYKANLNFHILKYFNIILLSFLKLIRFFETIEILGKIMVFKNDFESLYNLCNALYEKEFFGISYGSISQRINEESFFINKESTILKNITKDDFCKLVANESIRWNEASYDSYIHFAIYQSIKEAKYVVHTFSPYISALSYSTNAINLSRLSKEGIKSDMLKVFDTGFTNDEQLQKQIPVYFINTNQNIVLTKKSGAWSFGKDLMEVCENLYHLEHLCKIKHIVG